MKKISTIFLISFLAVFLVTGSAMAIPTSLSAVQDVLDDRTSGGISSVDADNDYLADEFDSHWIITAGSTAVATFIVELTNEWGEENNSFGVYDTTNPSNYIELFSSAYGPGGTNTLSVNRVTKEFGTEGTTPGGDIKNPTVFGSTAFGFYLTADRPIHGDYTLYSDSELNDVHSGSGSARIDVDNYDVMAAYQGVGDPFSVKNDGTYAPWIQDEWILAWEDLRPNAESIDHQDMVVMIQSATPVTEPATMLLLGSGLICLAGIGRKKFKT
jgi:hypothetical protein